MSQNKKKILIFGVSGNSGRYVAKHFLNQGCEVFGIGRRKEVNDLKNYLGHVINVCFGFHQAIKKYYYDKFNRNIINHCLIDVYKPTEECK